MSPVEKISKINKRRGGQLLESREPKVDLFHSDERIFERIRYLIMLKSNISDVYSHKYTKIKISSDDEKYGICIM